MASLWPFVLRMARCTLLLAPRPSSSPSCMSSMLMPDTAPWGAAAAVGAGPAAGVSTVGARCRRRRACVPALLASAHSAAAVHHHLHTAPGRATCRPSRMSPRSNEPLDVMARLDFMQSSAASTPSPNWMAMAANCAMPWCARRLVSACPLGAQRDARAESIARGLQPRGRGARAHTHVPRAAPSSCPNASTRADGAALRLRSSVDPSYASMASPLERRLVGRLRELRATQDWAGCVELEAEACTVALQAREPAAAAAIFNTLGNALQLLGEHARATERFEQALRIYAATGDDEGVARARLNLTTCHLTTGEYERAIRLLSAERAACQEAGEQHRLALLCCNLAVCHEAQGQHTQASDLHRRSIEIAEVPMQIPSRIFNSHLVSLRSTFMYLASSPLPKTTGASVLIAETYPYI